VGQKYPKQPLPQNYNNLIKRKKSNVDTKKNKICLAQHSKQDEEDDSAATRGIVMGTSHQYKEHAKIIQVEILGPRLVPQFSPNFTIQKEDFPSHQNIGKCMEY
jgi:hypothetical protein